MSRWNGITVTLPAGESLRCEPATSERLADVPAVLGERGGPGGCWCGFWRLRTAEWRAGGPTRRKAALTDRLAAVAMAKANGAPAVDAIPVAPGGRRGSGDLYTGTPAMFQPLGFTEIARRKPERPIVRLDLR